MTKPRKDIIRHDIRVLSWGLGVQSTALAVMSVNGDVEPFDLIVTSDTGWELPNTYQARDFYLEYLSDRGLT